MKKLIYSLGVILALCLASCGGSSNESSDNAWLYVSSPEVYEYQTCDYYGNLDAYGDYITDGYNVSFKGKNSDGYIHVGKVTLYSIGGISNTFYLFKKGNTRYAAEYLSGPFYSLSGSYVTIDNIKYKTH